MASELYVGLMSGTSLDGVDAVLARFDPDVALLAHRCLPLPADLRLTLGALRSTGCDEVHRSAVASNLLAELYARAVASLLADAGRAPGDVRAIGCHGQTIRHNPGAGYTVQIGNGARLAETTGLPVVCDFRSRDLAAGGQGAPLVPAFHSRVFGHRSLARAIVNIGGIANISFLPPGGTVTGFDCGPGNALLDEWAGLHLGTTYDAQGAWAARGRVDAALLQDLLREPFFAGAPPKSTGRELFNLQWLRARAGAAHAPADVQATLAELTAASIAEALTAHCPGTEEVYVCGGGASNVDLMHRLATRLAPRALSTTERLGIGPDWVEAAAFAWLARETLAGRPGNLPAVTGATGPRVLGCIYPA